MQEYREQRAISASMSAFRKSAHEQAVERIQEQRRLHLEQGYLKEIVKNGIVVGVERVKAEDL